MESVKPVMAYTADYQPNASELVMILITKIKLVLEGGEIMKYETPKLIVVKLIPGMGGGS